MAMFYSINYKKLTDEALINLIAKGKNKAFDEIYNRYSKTMLNFFFKRMLYDDSRAQDFLQDLFIKIIEYSEKFDTNLNFKTWMYTIAYNMVKNHYRNDALKAKKRQRSFKKIYFCIRIIC